MKMLRTFLLSVATLAFTNCIAQPLSDEIREFKKQDSIRFPPANAILFVGSSSFRKWQDVGKYFPGHTIINRGFGGSTLPDVIRYADEIIIPYHPKQVVIYCGDNDLASSDTVTAEVVFRRFKELFHLIRTRLRTADILYVSVKPSPSREKLMPRMEEVNRLISGFLRRQKHAAFVDVYHPMLTSEGKPMEDIFENDKLHMNTRGYAIWQKLILPHLDKP